MRILSWIHSQTQDFSPSCSCASCGSRRPSPPRWTPQLRAREAVPRASPSLLSSEIIFHYTIYRPSLYQSTLPGKNNKIWNFVRQIRRISPFNSEKGRVDSGDRLSDPFRAVDILSLPQLPQRLTPQLSAASFFAFTPSPPLLPARQAPRLYGLRQK